MKQQILNRFFLVCAIALIAGAFSVPKGFYQNLLGSESTITKFFNQQKITLGLDLAGGTELDYKIDLSEAIEQNNDDDAENDVNLEDITESVRDALERRVNPAGIGEIIVKRSQINNEEHVLIQMPPSSNVAAAKAQAESDNRLEFYEEDPVALGAKLLEVSEYVVKDFRPENQDIDDATWKKRIEELKALDPLMKTKTIGPKALSTLQNQELKEKIETTNPGQTVDAVIDGFVGIPFEGATATTTEGEEQPLSFDIPTQVLAIARLTAKEDNQVEKELPESVSARHILIAYPEASNPAEDLPYANKEEAQAKAEELLQQVKDGGDFEALAKEFSTGPSGPNGGDLGEFNPGQMVPPFNDAVFAQKAAGIVETVIETIYGFHVIEVTDYKPERTETVNDPNVSYELAYWDQNQLPWKKTELGGAQLDVARAGFDQVGTPLVDLKFNGEGQKFFGEITERLANQQCSGGQACRLQIRVGGTPVTSPTVREKILTANAQITGSFTTDEAKLLADNLNLGAIQAPVTLSNETKIQAELGAAQLNQSIRAALFGFLGTILFMIFMYRVPGIVAAISLCLYAAIYLTILKIWPESFGGPIVLSLAGAAGVALSIGLAVDGNILIFERTKEEIKKGKPLIQAIDLGFERAWSAIRDSNLTTLITCLILFSIGSSVIKGFAVTLIVGTLLSMFTAVTVSRNLLRALLLLDIKKPELYGVKTSEVGKKLQGPKLRKRK